MRTAPGIGAVAETKDRNCGGSLLSPPDWSAQAPDVFTAIPVGPRHWRVKALSTGHIELLGLFNSRLQALGAAVLLARQVGGSVVR